VPAAAEEDSSSIAGCGRGGELALDQDEIIEEMPATPARRPRRSTEEVRERLLDASRELFLANGYEATSTKQIAAKAGVAEKVLYGNFGSKAGIFDATFVEPFADLADRYVAAWGEEATSTLEERISSFVSGLYDLVYSNRAVLRAALTRRSAGGTNAHSEIITHLARTIQSIMRIEQQTLPDVDQSAALIAVAGMVFGVVLLDDMLTPPGQRRPGRKRLETEMTNLVLHGVLHRAP
jgi:AcrR family transcriptional regulator